MLQRKTQGIDHPMTGHASSVLSQLSDFFSHGDMGLKIILIEGDGHRGRFHFPSNHLSSHENSPMNRRRAVGVGKGTQQIGMSEHSSPSAILDLNPHPVLESRFLCHTLYHETFFGLHEVELNHLGAEQKIICKQKVAVIGCVTPNHAVNEQVQRLTQSPHETGGESGEQRSVLGQIALFQLKPMFKEGSHFKPCQRMVHHPCNLLLQFIGG